jgi:uncharacterized protein with HEPN domain
VIKRSELGRLRDILEDIEAVGEMMADVDLAAYRRDYKLRRAVERCVEIVSEASRNIPDYLKTEFPISRARRSRQSEICCGTAMKESMI